MSTPVSGTVDALEPISLADLDAIAALQVRNDRKYVVNDTIVDLMLCELAGGLQILQIDGLRAFNYRSVYFDTSNFDLHHAAAGGRRRRFKVRTRTYEDSAKVMLEVKTKDGRGRTVKERLDYDIDNSSHLTPEGRRFVQMALASSDVPVTNELLNRGWTAPGLDHGIQTVDDRPRNIRHACHDRLCVGMHRNRRPQYVARRRDRRVEVAHSSRPHRPMDVGPRTSPGEDQQVLDRPCSALPRAAVK